MSTPNNNYVQSLAGFTANDYYEAGDVADFNAVDDFAAFVLFWIRGQYQNSDPIGAQDSFLWGNIDDANFTGWAIRIVAGSTFDAGGTTRDPVLVGALGDGVANFNNASLLLTDVTANVLKSGYTERLILATLMFDAGNALAGLGVNGSLPGLTGAVYVPSALPPRLGLNPDGSQPATDVDIVSAGYIQGDLFSGATFGRVAGDTFRNARENNNGAFFTNQVIGLDWVHRYVAINNGPGTLVRSAQGTALAAYPPAPASLVDVGASGRGNLAAGSLFPPNPLALTRTGAGTVVDQIKNPDWYASEGFLFNLPA